MDLDPKYFKKFNKRIALLEPNIKEYTYSEVLSKIKKLNNLFESNSVILLIASNTIASIIGYLSFCCKIKKCTTILIDDTFKESSIKNIIKSYKPNYLFYPENYIKSINIDLSHIKSFENYKLSKTFFNKNKKINKNNFLLISTSGTTGSVKFVRLSRKNIIENSKSIIKNLKIKKSHTTITTMPMGYSYGLSILNTHLLSGAKIIVNKRNIFNKNFWQIINNFKVSSFGGVPLFFEYLKKLKFENFNLKNIIYITQAGGKLEDNVASYFINICKEKKYKFFCMYGQAEASPRISSIEISKYPKKINSIGKSLDGIIMKLLDKKKNFIKKSYKIGEIIIKGPNVSLGYAKTFKDLFYGNINKGQIRTGDLGYFDNQGFFYLTGRIKRISKIFGFRVNLDEIEAFLKKNNIITKCIPNNKKLKITIIKNYDQSKIQNMISKEYNINKNYIIFEKVKKFENQNKYKLI